MADNSTPSGATTSSGSSPSVDAALISEVSEDQDPVYQRIIAKPVQSPIKPKPAPTPAPEVIARDNAPEAPKEDGSLLGFFKRFK